MRSSMIAMHCLKCRKQPCGGAQSTTWPDPPDNPNPTGGRGAPHPKPDGGAMRPSRGGNEVHQEVVVNPNPTRGEGGDERIVFPLQKGCFHSNRVVSTPA